MDSCPMSSPRTPGGTASSLPHNPGKASPARETHDEEEGGCDEDEEGEADDGEGGE